MVSYFSWMMAALNGMVSNLLAHLTQTLTFSSVPLFVTESWGIDTPSKTIEKEQSRDENMNYTVQKVVKYKEQRKCLIVSFIIFKFLIAS